MDESNPNIIFDEKGECNCCKEARSRMPHEWFPNPEGRKLLESLVAELKRCGEGHSYDCMIGLSGGIDSAYVTHFLRREFGLRLLAVHVDGGWNSESAVYNIEALVRRLNLDLYTYVVEWEEMRDLQCAFLRASVLNQDIPQDHAFFATLYRTAVKFGIRHFISGINFSSECVAPSNWGYPAMDGKHLRGVHARFGTGRLDTFPVLGLPEHLWLTKIRKQLHLHRILNFLPYDKEAAKREIALEYGWKDYGGKHHESRFTKFYEEVYLPIKAGFDKRRLHLSSLIVSGQMTRQDALEILKTPICNPNEVSRHKRFVAKKLDLSDHEMEDLLNSPISAHHSFPNNRLVYKFGASVKSFARMLTFK